MLPRLLTTALIASLCLACTDSEEPVGDLPDQWLFGGDRGVMLRAPDNYDHNKSHPLLISLHGYRASGLTQLFYARLDLLVNNYGVLVAAPDGTFDEDGKRFWNATDACCDFWDTGVDDLGYISGLITEISAEWNVDPKRVYLFGHSNGAFMAYQLACHHADKIAAVATLAGATQQDQTACDPSEPVNVLHLHGDQDPDVIYSGEPHHPGAEASAGYWADYNGCASTRTLATERLDIDTAIDGAETRIERHDGCPDGVSVDMWTLEGSGHLPVFPDSFSDELWAWFEAHAKR